MTPIILDSVTPSQISRKKRRASDIGIREFFDAAKRYSRREKEPRIEEELNMPKLKKLPMAKKTKSPANGIRTTPDKTLQEVLKRKSKCFFQFSLVNIRKHS